MSTVEAKPSTSKEEIIVKAPGELKDKTEEKSKPPEPRKQETTKISFDIKTKRGIANLAKKFGPHKSLPSAKTPATHDDFFTKMNIVERVESDTGDVFTIDVQPDLRFPFAYLLATTTLDYPNLEVKSYPYVSPMSIVAYKQILLHASFLLHDIYNRTVTTNYAATYKNDAGKRDFLNLILNLKVPKDTQRLIEQLAPTYDPSRPLELFVPSFAGCSLHHDFGRLIPPTIMIDAHNILASTRTNADPLETTRRLYNTNILLVDNEEVKIGHLLGSYYAGQNNQTMIHRNWLNERFENVFNPLIGRALIQRPTLARTLVTPYEIQLAQFNPYDYLLGYNEDNAEVISRTLTNISSFFEATIGSLPTIAQVLDNASGFTILTHSIERVTLPTWHSLPPSIDYAAQPVPINDRAYATYVNFLVDFRVFREANLPPVEGINAEMYLIQDADYVRARTPFPPLLFTRDNVLPDALWFQPYDKTIPVISLSCALGLKIEQENIDGVVLPLPDIRMSLTENNSWYQQGSVPIAKVRPYIPSNADDNALRLASRVLHTSEEPPMGLAFRDMSRNLIPRFVRNACREAFNFLYGLVFVQNFNDNRNAFTYVGWKDNVYPNIPDNYTYLWSSYRYVERSNTNRKVVHFFSTMRGHYGLSPTLTRSRNPILLYPY